MLQFNLRITISKLIQLALALLRLHQDLILYTLKTSIGWHLLRLGVAILLHHCIIISSNLEIGRALFFVH